MSDLPPHDLDAEQNLLGALMLSQQALQLVREHLRPSDFYRGSHGSIYEAICALDDAGQAADTITVCDQLRKMGVLEDVGQPVVWALADAIPAVANVRLYGKIVREQSRLRQIRAIGQRITAAATTEATPDEVQRTVEALVGELEDTPESEGLVEASDALGPVLEDIRDAITTGVARRGLSTGLAELDALTRGLLPGRFYIVAARPGMGKSILGVNWAEETASHGIPTALYSLEMGREEITRRMLASQGLVDYGSVQTGVLSKDEQKRIASAADKIRQMPLFIDDGAQGEITAAGIRASVRRLHRQAGCGLVVVDYLQLMMGETHQDNRNLELAGITRQLKMLAMELQIPVVALSQLNRGVENRGEKRPTLGDLRDSGALEQDADQVLFIYRDEYYNLDSPDAGIAELILAKNRTGPLGTVRAAFRGKYCLFGNLARAERTPAPPSYHEKDLPDWAA